MNDDSPESQPDRIERSFKIWWHTALGALSVREHEIAQKAYIAGFNQATAEKMIHRELARRSVEDRW